MPAVMAGHTFHNLAQSANHPLKTFSVLAPKPKSPTHITSSGTTFSAANLPAATTFWNHLTDSIATALG
ncbi:hypothetical protein BKA93DRAFT_791929 [Sparassis latifolia]